MNCCPSSGRNTWLERAPEIQNCNLKFAAYSTPASRRTSFFDSPASLFAEVLNLPAWQPRLSPGDLLSGRFEIRRFLARGGMGEVYEAFDRELNEDVALKTIRDDLAIDPEAVQQFKREVRRARSVASSHVCRVYDLFFDSSSRDDSLVFLTMQLLNGETLAQRLRTRGPFSPEAALPLIGQIAEGMRAAHKQRLVHGDLKPGNVMLTGDDPDNPVAVITDFGLARPAPGNPDTGSANEPLIAGGGTLLYMAPEQLQGGQATELSDIYSFGLVAYELLTGKLPFDGVEPDDRVWERLHKTPTPPRFYVPGVPRKLGACDPSLPPKGSCLTSGKRCRCAQRLSHPDISLGTAGPPS